jgi:hypothetical protein
MEQHRKTCQELRSGFYGENDDMPHCRTLAGKPNLGMPRTGGLRLMILAWPAVGIAGSRRNDRSSLPAMCA